MELTQDDVGNPRFFDFKKRPYDAVNPRLTFQFWPAIQSELKRKGLSCVLDLQFNPLPPEPTASLRRIKHDDALAKTRLIKYETDYDDYLLGNGSDRVWTCFGLHRKRNGWLQNRTAKTFGSSRSLWRSRPRRPIRLWGYSTLSRQKACRLT